MFQRAGETTHSAQVLDRNTQRKKSGRQLAWMFLNMLVPFSNFSMQFDVMKYIRVTS